MHDATMTRRNTLALTCLALVMACAAPSHAAETVEHVDAAAPDQLAEPIRALLGSGAIRLSDDDGPFYDLWFRAKLPLADGAAPFEGRLAPDAIAEGALVGAIRVHRERYDFRDEEVPAGVYTLRMALQPVDGDHLGTAPTRTFFLLIRAADDQSADPIADMDHLHELAMNVNAAGHPSNLNLQPVPDPPAELPALGENRSEEFKFVILALAAEGGDAPVVLALVYEGFGVH